MTLISPVDACPRCASALVSERQRAPWCPACQWNLDLYEPDRRPPELGWRWVDRATFRLAYRLTQGQFAALRGRPVDRPGWGLARIVLLAIAVVLLAAILACVYFGIVLIAYHFPSPTIVPGAALVLLALLLRPRLGRFDKYAQELTREQAPTLFRLIDEVAQALGTPRPHIVAVNDEFNATAGAYGLRRRRAMCLGLPLLGVLSPQERVALIGHEMGHFVNGDVRRGPLAGLPVTALNEVTGLLRQPPRRPTQSLIMLVTDLAIRPLFGILRFVAWWASVGLLWIGARESQRAEYLADQLSARAAGTEAATSVLDAFVAADVVTMIVAREARQRLGPADWRAAVTQTRHDLRTRIERLRQLSVRDEVSMFASHPPSGLRAALVASRPYETAAVVLSETDAERMDTELRRQYEWAGRTLASG